MIHNNSVLIHIDIHPAKEAEKSEEATGKVARGVVQAEHVSVFYCTPL